MVIIFVQDVRTYIRSLGEKILRKARGSAGVASHGKHTRATEHVKKLGNIIFRLGPKIALQVDMAIL